MRLVQLLRGTRSPCTQTHSYVVHVCFLRLRPSTQTVGDELLSLSLNARWLFGYSCHAHPRCLVQHSRCSVRPRALPDTREAQQKDTKNVTLLMISTLSCTPHRPSAGLAPSFPQSDLGHQAKPGLAKQEGWSLSHHGSLVHSLGSGRRGGHGGKEAHLARGVVLENEKDWVREAYWTMVSSTPFLAQMRPTLQDPSLQKSGKGSHPRQTDTEKKYISLFEPSRGVSLFLGKVPWHFRQDPGVRGSPMVAKVFDMTVNLVFAWHTISPSLPSDTSFLKAPKVSAPAPRRHDLAFCEGGVDA